MFKAILFVIAVIACVATLSNAYAGEYIPKSYYTIDHAGHPSHPVYLRSKRDAEDSVDVMSLIRPRRGLFRKAEQRGTPDVVPEPSNGIPGGSVVVNGVARTAGEGPSIIMPAVASTTTAPKGWFRNRGHKNCTHSHHHRNSARSTRSEMHQASRSASGTRGAFTSSVDSDGQ